jgi:hypothetical protein
MKSFGGVEERVGGGWRVGEENLWLWGKKKNPSYPKSETRRLLNIGDIIIGDMYPQIHTPVH